MLNEGTADEGEPDLNRRLYRAIVAAHAEAARSGDEAVSVVVPEGRNPPVASDPLPAAREHKIPDFYWAYVDHLAPAPDAIARQFVVECKRIRAPTRNWDFVEQYVLAGVIRFLTEEHAYGKDARSGAMVGYLQAMDARSAHEAVNLHLTNEAIAPLAVRHLDERGIHEFDHRFDRPYPESPFSLVHFWVQVSN